MGKYLVLIQLLYILSNSLSTELGRFFSAMLGMLSLPGALRFWRFLMISLTCGRVNSGASFAYRFL